MPAEVERFFFEQSLLIAEVASFNPSTQQHEMDLAVADVISDSDDPRKTVTCKIGLSV